MATGSLHKLHLDCQTHWMDLFRLADQDSLAAKVANLIDLCVQVIPCYHVSWLNRLVFNRDLWSQKSLCLSRHRDVYSSFSYLHRWGQTSSLGSWKYHSRCQFLCQAALEATFSFVLSCVYESSGQLGLERGRKRCRSLFLKDSLCIDERAKNYRQDRNRHGTDN